MSHPSRSDEQQEVEDAIRRELKKRYASERVDCGDDYVIIDAVGRKAGKVVELIEISAHQGKLKGGQLKKSTDDAARLMLAQKKFRPKPKLRLAWSCEEAIGQVQRSWRGKALEAMGIEFVFIDLPNASDDKIKATQKRQRR